MSSDYIPRLRSELLRAAASQEASRARTLRRGGEGRPATPGGESRRQPVAPGGEDARRPAGRRRPARTLRRLRPVGALAAVALVIAAVVITVPRDRADDRPVPPGATLQLGDPTTPADTAATLERLRERFEAMGIEATVSSSGGQVKVAAPPEAEAAVRALMVPGHLEMYYWEGSVLGPDGEPAPGDPEVTGGPDAGRGAALTKAEAEERASRARDARVVRAETGDGYYAVAGPAAVTNVAIEDARLAKDPMSGDPIVALEFTSRGQQAFGDLTRDVAQGGADHARGGDPMLTSHHFAVVIDDRIVTMPFLDWRMNPGGVDGALGAQIVTGSEEEARRLAAILDSGPLP